MSRSDYESEVYYEVWRNGGNPDAVDPDRLDDYRWDGLSEDEAAYRELSRQREVHEPPMEEYYE